MLEDLARFINPLKRKLERAGVEFEPESPRLADTNQGDPAWT
jgi:hypothetical protein